MFALSSREDGVRVELQLEVHGMLECDASVFDPQCVDG